MPAEHSDTTGNGNGHKPSTQVFQNLTYGWRVVGIRGSLYNVFLALVSMAGGTGQIDRVSIRYLAEYSNIAIETARGHVRELVRLGLLKTERRKRPGDGKFVTSRYFLSRGQYWPRDTKEYKGEAQGGRIWKKLIAQLPRQHDWMKAILFCYWDCSRTEDLIKQNRHGILYVMIEPNREIEKAFLADVADLKRLPCPGFQIEYIRLLKRIDFGM